MPLTRLELLAAPILQLYPAEAEVPSAYPPDWHCCTHCGGHGEVEVWAGQSAKNDLTVPCHRCRGAGSAKDLIRFAAGHRCERCRHPFVVGQSGEWALTLASDPETLTPPEMFEGIEDVAQPVDRRERGVNWSPCDEECSHMGPVRIAGPGGIVGVEWGPTSYAEGDSAGRLLERVRLTGEAFGLNDPVVDRDKLEIQASWRILTVHHLNGEKRDLRWWNLAALCQRCHLEIQGKVNMAQLWTAEHTPWFRPHAAGYYAMTYLDEELGAGEALEREEELLALERAS